jgi:hypothetical protein
MHIILDGLGDKVATMIQWMTTFVVAFIIAFISGWKLALNVCTAHALMRFCHLINRSFVCKTKEGRHVRILYKPNFK